MKSLSILILIGTLSAIVLGAIFAVTPVLAQSTFQTQEANLAGSQPVAPVTGNSSAASAAVEAAPLAQSNSATDPGLVLANTFSVDLQKDTASAQAVQEAQAEAAAQEAALSMGNFDNFVASVSNGKASQVTGIYVEDVLAYSVVRQPGGNAAFVSENAGEVTQFGLAAQYGSQAFLAHNYLAGASFATLSQGQIITVVYGDGSSQQFRIESIKRYQALSPDSTQSSFVDLESGKQLSASSLFHTVYNNDNSVVLQTCISQNGVTTWGRMFITAVPLS